MGIEFNKVQGGTLAENVSTPTPEDLDAALELIAENEALKNHPRVKELVANNFMTADGRQLDPGNFLSRVLKSLDTSSQVSEAEYKRLIDEAMVTHSDPTR